ncbi:MAG: translation initiation inhibitor [Verrucomicrobia bacterium]|nr:translation initiation inhibitor [Verrucomicrobiota bacterium]
MSPSIRREHSPGLQLTLLRHRRVRELHLTLRSLPGESAAGLSRRLVRVLQKHRAAIVKQDCFGALAAYPDSLRAFRESLGPIRWPLTWADGADCGGGTLAGCHVLAMCGAEVQPVRLEGRIVGTTFHDGASRHCFVGNLRPANIHGSRADQSRRAYASLDAVLQRVGMSATHVVRTWFFLDHILDWYDTFNEVRAEYFRRRRVFDHLVPASTGIGASNPAGAALVLGAWAIQPPEDRVRIAEVSSPLQCPAPDYGSCFSRAVEIGTPHSRHLLVSGTASIEPGGRSAHDGDITSQIALTMRVVRGILNARGMRFRDATRASAYLKRPGDAPAFAAWCRRHAPSLRPVLTMQAEVCRDELLFEIELDAVVPVSPSSRRTAPKVSAAV